MKNKETKSRNMNRRRIRALTLTGSLASLATSPLAWPGPALIGDSYVISGSPKNFGSKATLLVAAGSRNGYIKFNLDKSVPASGTIAKATLRLYVSGVKKFTNGSLQVQGLTSDWNEYTIGKTAPPTLGDILYSTSASPSSNQWIELDVTDFVSAHIADSAVSFALTGTDTLNIKIDSKESRTTGHEPELDIIWASTGSADPAGATSATGATGATGAAGAAGATSATGAVGSIASSVILTVTYTDPAAGASLTSACNVGETVLTGGVTQPLGLLNVVSGILQTSAPTLSSALATAGQTADGWSGTLWRAGRFA